MSLLVRSATGRVLLGLVLLLGLPATSAADWHLTPLIGYTFKGSTTLVDLKGAAEVRHWNYGGAVMLLGDGPVGLEAFFLHTPGFFQRGGEGLVVSFDVVSSRTDALMGNAVLTVPRRLNRYGLRPYVSGGLGLLHASSRDQLNVTPVRLNLLGMNVGAGAVGLLSDRVGLRFDLRYIRKVQGPDPEAIESPPVPPGLPIRLRYWTSTLGVVFRY